MTTDNQHRGTSGSGKISDDFLRNLDIKFTITKEEAWKSIESKMSDQPETKTGKESASRIFLYAAASIAIILASAIFLRYYSVGVSSDNESVAVMLPDGSDILLAPGSGIHYNPLWWPVTRNLKLEGEAIFNVTKGNNFKVVSENGITEVLGTTFTITSNTLTYTVSCFTGSVRVTDPKSDVSAILTANEKAELKREGVFEIKLISPENRGIITKKDYITFKNSSIQSVFDELEMQFGVSIECSQQIDHFYTGNLKTGNDIEEILSVICLPLELEYVQISNNKYLIRPAETR